MKYPTLILDKKKLKHNIDTVVDWCHARGVQCFVVTKVVCADPEVVSLIEDSDADGFADSRVENLASIETKKDRLMLRIGSPDGAEAVVRCCDISLQSELRTLEALQTAAESAAVRHKVILTIDLGDLREGIYFENRKQILETAEYICKAENLELLGIGTNLTCYGAILPDSSNLGVLTGLAAWLRNELNQPVPVISGGNSSSLDMLIRGELPEKINHLRIGEAIMLGQNTANCVHIPALYDDAFMLKAELVEIQTKPSKPVGTAYKNAFGEQVCYEDVGQQKRGILAIGRQDVVIDGLSPLNADISILGGSSDHLLVDLTHSPRRYEVGDILEFKLNYGALLALSTSKYVIKVSI